VRHARPRPVRPAPKPTTSRPRTAPQPRIAPQPPTRTKPPTPTRPAARETCPECGGRTRVDAAERVCTDCGLVVEADRIDHGPEWRSFDDDDTNPKHRRARH